MTTPMTPTTSMTATPQTHAPTPVPALADTAQPSVARAFRSVLWRDVFVTLRELPVFLAQVLLQPLFLLFVFGKVLASIGATQSGYADLLFPGIVGLTLVTTGLQSTALPLVLDFSFGREIEDRLLAPMPVMLVAVEKMLFAALRAIVAAVVMFPIGWLVLGHIPGHAGGIPLLLLTILLGAALGAAIGLTLGTLVPPSKITIMFAVIFTPLLFTGCTQYPWPSLSRLRWFQVVTACNPLTYVSEAMRAALVPSVNHISPWVDVPVVIVAIGVFSAIGMAGFRRRALD
jgi:ABC-2 type transport system permease protein